MDKRSAQSGSSPGMFYTRLRLIPTKFTAIPDSPSSLASCSSSLVYECPITAAPFGKEAVGFAVAISANQVALFVYIFHVSAVPGRSHPVVCAGIYQQCSLDFSNYNSWNCFD